MEFSIKRTARLEFSPAAAALEGVRVVRREPQAVIYWIFVWALALAAIGAIKALGGGPVARGAPRDTLGLLRSYGPLATILVPLLLGLWVMNTATVYRAVLRPGEHGWHLFKLGADEARIAVVSAVGAVLIAVFGGVPAYLLFVLFSPIFQAAPGLNRQIALVGAVTTIVLDFWIILRFSLVAVHTFATQRFDVAGYWPFTRGRSFALFLAYLLVVAEILVVALVLFLVGGWIEQALMTTAHGWTGPQIWRRVILLALVPFVAAQAAAFSVALTVLLGGCQAFAYRAIEARRSAAA
jgi:hypothetical protein